MTSPQHCVATTRARMTAVSRYVLLGELAALNPKILDEKLLHDGNLT